MQINAVWSPIKENPATDRYHPSAHLSVLYSPVDPWYSIVQVQVQYLLYQSVPAVTMQLLLLQIINTVTIVVVTVAITVSLSHVITYIAWPLLREFFSCRFDSLLACWWTHVLANPINICRHTWPVVCGNISRSFWYGHWCFATVREHKTHFPDLSVIFSISH